MAFQSDAVRPHVTEILKKPLQRGWTLQIPIVYRRGDADEHDLPRAANKWRYFCHSWIGGMSTSFQLAAHGPVHLFLPHACQFLFQIYFGFDRQLQYFTV